MKNLKRFAVAFGMVAMIGGGSLISPEKAEAKNDQVAPPSNSTICRYNKKMQLCKEGRILSLRPRCLNC
jgi:hypothetical protein